MFPTRGLYAISKLLIDSVTTVSGYSKAIKLQQHKSEDTASDLQHTVSARHLPGLRRERAILSDAALAV